MSLTKTTYSMLNGACLNVLDFGAVGDGVADDTASIQAAVDSLVPLNGGVILFPWGTYKITDTILITTSNTVLQGYGGEDLHDGGSGPAPATTITWGGGTFAGSMFDFRTPKNVSSTKRTGMGLNNMYIQCNGLCAAGVNLVSVNRSMFTNIFVLQPTYTGFQITNWNAGEIGEAADSQRNIFTSCSVRTYGPAASLNAHGFVLSNQSPGVSLANPSFNTFINCYAQTRDGDAFNLEDCDNNAFYSCTGTPIGSGRGIFIKGGDSNYFYNHSTSGFPSKITIQGTAEGAFNTPVQNSFLFADQGNGTTYPNLGTGCKVYWTGSRGITDKARSAIQYISDFETDMNVAEAKIGNSSLCIHNSREAGYRITNGINTWSVSQQTSTGDLRIVCDESGPMLVLPAPDGNGVKFGTQVLTTGAADSGGTGYRILRVPN